eukprot:5948680-Amphidinium_carterae.1
MDLKRFGWRVASVHMVLHNREALFAKPKKSASDLDAAVEAERAHTNVPYLGVAYEWKKLRGARMGFSTVKNGCKPRNPPKDQIRNGTNSKPN